MPHIRTVIAALATAAVLITVYNNRRTLFVKDTQRDITARDNVSRFQQQQQGSTSW